MPREGKQYVKNVTMKLMTDVEVLVAFACYDSLVIAQEMMQ
jgi:hypothetical protein